jgi:hypothetical protein
MYVELWCLSCNSLPFLLVQFPGYNCFVRLLGKEIRRTSVDYGSLTSLFDALCNQPEPAASTSLLLLGLQLRKSRLTSSVISKLICLHQT